MVKLFSELRQWPRQILADYENITSKLLLSLTAQILILYLFFICLGRTILIAKLNYIQRNYYQFAVIMLELLSELRQWPCQILAQSENIVFKKWLPQSPLKVVWSCFQLLLLNNYNDDYDEDSFLYAFSWSSFFLSYVNDHARSWLTMKI